MTITSVRPGLILILLALVVVLTPKSPAYAAGITVTTTADTIDAAVNCPSVTLASLPGPNGQTSLREAVCAANNNAGPDTITFSVNGTFALTGAANEDNGGTGDLDIKQSLDIQGNGAANTILDGSGIERIFDVFPSAASTFGLSNLTLQNGDTRSTSFKEGGAIYLHNNVTSTFNAILVINNFSGANGAIENRGTLTINNSVISNNQTIPASGTVVGGGIHNAGALTIDNTTIANNSVRGEGGGIATTTAVAVVVNITDSTISGNTASVTGGGLGNGGGISTTGNQGTLNITNSTISGNRADVNGGGAYFVTPGGGTGNATLTNVTISNNTADNDNNSTGAGGGLAQNTAAVTLRNTIVAGNFNSTAATRDDISGAVVASSSFNLVGNGTGSSGITNGVNNNQVGSGASPVNALLSPLVNNGGSTETHALLGGSPALDTGNNAICPSTDQRGVPRPGNATCDKGSYELNDTTPPDTTITSNPTNPSNSTSATFTFTGSDNVTPAGNLTFQCQLDGGGFSACTSPRTYSGLADGSHIFQVRAIDQANNTDPTPATYTWIVDATAPNTTITANPTNPSASTTAGFSFTGNDGSGTGVVSFQCQLDGGGFSTCTSPQTYTGLSQGSHTFQVRTIDGAGNVDPSPASFTWVIDTVAPDTTITANPTNPSNSTNASFSFTGGDPGGSGVASFQCQLDGGGFSACTSPRTYTGLSDGSHTFQVRAIDATGNTDLTPASYTWTVDTSAPTAAFSSAAPDPTNTSPIPVTVAFNESVSSFTSGDITTSNGTVSNFAGSGTTYTFDLVPSGQGLATANIAAGVAQDVAGNGNTTVTQFSRSYDSVAPTVALTSAAPNPTTTSPIPVTVTFSESVSGFTATDISTSNATVSNFAGSSATYTFDLIPSGVGLVTADISAGATQDAASNPNAAATQFSRTFVAAEIALLGNNILIPNGDITPFLADQTDFDSVILGGAITHTFTISNSGGADLTLSGSPLVALSGPGAGDFSIVANPVTPVISNTSTTFQVRFNPLATGTSVAIVTIASYDSDENPYTFAIAGASINSSPGNIPIYLPLLFKNAVSAPDLVIDSLSAGSSGVTLVIRNAGNVAVGDAFWVDVYFNPTSTPTLNKRWQDIASHGQVWGIQGAALPLDPGESLTLTSGDAYYFPQFSSSPPLPVGANVFVLVDSVDFSTLYGAVRESNEANNLAGPVISTAASGASSVLSLHETAGPSLEGLPPRQ